MIKQEVIWYSVKEDGAPQFMPANGYQLLVRNKHYGYCMIMDAFYNPCLKVWFESEDGLNCTEISKDNYEILYYTSDLGFRAIDKFFSSIEVEHD